MRARACLALVVAILLVAAALRSWRLAEIPPGVEHDEVAEWQIARSILAGRHAIFFREAYGQEPAYLYLQAASITLLGDRVFALRFTSFAVAMLTIAACHRLMRRLFGPVAALTSIAFIAVTLWPLFFARVAIRGMTLPLMMCLGTDAMFSSLQSASDRRPQAARRRSIIAGLWFGLAAYTYLAARAIPILFAGFTVCLALSAREQMHSRWKGFVAMLALAVLLAAPLAVYILRNPDVQFRVDEVSEPLKQLERGDPSGVLAGLRDTALMFSVRGDQTVRDNWPYRPVFAEPLGAALFYIGLAVALWRWRKPECAFMLMWLVTLLLPAVVTAAPPNFVRALGALPPILAFPGIGTAVLVEWTRRWHRQDMESARKAHIICGLGVSAVVVLNFFLTARDYFVYWPAHPETQFVWQTDLAAVARQLDSEQNVSPDVAISGLSNETMDDDSLRLLMKRRDLRIRWFDSRTTLVIPAQGGRLFIPQIVPLDPSLRTRLLEWGAQEHRDPSSRFAWFDAPAVRITELPTSGLAPAGGSFLDVSPDNGMMLLSGETLSLQARPGEEITALTYWQVGALPQAPLRAFVHMTDATGRIVAQFDGLNAPPEFWRAGDVIVQLHRLLVPADTTPGTYQLRVGLYSALTQARARFPAAADHLRLPDVEVRP